MTNLEKLKSEIAEMNAEEFRDWYCADFVCIQIGRCLEAECKDCILKWLKKESDEKE